MATAPEQVFLLSHLFSRFWETLPNIGVGEETKKLLFYLLPKFDISQTENVFEL